MPNNKTAIKENNKKQINKTILSGFILLLTLGGCMDTSDKDRAENIAQKVYKTMNNAITYEQTQNIKLDNFPEVEKEYKKGNSYIVPVKGTILLVEGEYEKAYNLYTKELEKTKVINDKELTDTLLFGLFQLILHHNKYEDKIINFYKSFHKNNKEKYENIIAFMLYQINFCKDKNKAIYWKNILLKNDVSNAEKILKMNNKISCN